MDLQYICSKLQTPLKTSMDEILCEMNNRNQTESILMMDLLKSAKENAHIKACSVNGPIECLNETSKFYELSIIQIEASLKLIKEEPKDQTPETTRKNMLTNLINLKDLFHGRLNETKCSMMEKDKELIDRLESEFRLRYDLELKEKELVSLRSKLTSIMSKTSTNLANFVPKLQSLKDKESEKDRLRLEQNVMNEQMSFDIKNSKHILDLAYGLIHKTKVRQLDQQCRSSIEKDIILAMIKGFVHDQSIEYLKNEKRYTIDDISKKDTIIAKLMEERYESALKTMTMEEHYMILINQCYNECWSDEIERNVREDVFLYVLREVIKDWRVYHEKENIKIKLTDEIYKSVFLETMNDVKIKSDFELQKSKNEELVYKKAFLRRCQNIILAETEVDLLGDQVEALQDLLRNIYLVLDQNSSVLSHNFQVTEILKLIRKELGF